MSTDRDEMFGETPKGTPMYCMICERTYPYGEYRTMSLDMGEELLQMCPYEDCDGDAVINAHDWDWVLEKHPEYPETPERGVVYPLH